MASRVEQAQRNRGRILEVRDYPGKSRPATYFDDIPKSSSDGHNLCFSSNFDLREVRLSDGTEPPPILH